MYDIMWNVRAIARLQAAIVQFVRTQARYEIASHARAVLHMADIMWKVRAIVRLRAAIARIVL